MSDDIKDALAATRLAAAEAVRGLSTNSAAIAGRTLAGGLSMQALKNLPTMDERFDFASAAKAIASVARALDEAKEGIPEGKVLDVTMVTPDGRVMGVELVKPIGYSTYLAKGYINEMPCTILAHISSLNLFCAYVEPMRGRSRPGFVIEVPELIEPQPEPAQKQADTK